MLDLRRHKFLPYYCCAAALRPFSIGLEWYFADFWIHCAVGLAIATPSHNTEDKSPCRLKDQMGPIGMGPFDQTSYCGLYARSWE